MEYLAILATTFILGSVIGSFLTVLITRLPKEETVVHGRSKCPQCGHVLEPKDLLPIVSFVLSLGSCRHCHSKISLLYPTVEIITGLSFVLAALYALGQYGITIYAFVTWVYLAALLACFIALIVIDLRELLLPDILVLSAFVITAAYHLIVFTFFRDIFVWQTVIYGYLFGLGVAIAFLLLIIVTRGKGMGGGDMKFALVLGAAAGWPNAIAALFIAFVSGAIISMGLLAIRRKRITDVIPFGPFLIIGTIIGMFYGVALIDFYFAKLLG